MLIQYFRELINSPKPLRPRSEEVMAAFTKAENLIMEMLSMFPDMPELARHYEDDLEFDTPIPLGFLSKFMTMRAEMEIALLGLRRFTLPEHEKLMAMKEGLSLEGRVPMDLGWDRQKEKLLGDRILQFKEHVESIRALSSG